MSQSCDAVRRAERRSDVLQIVLDHLTAVLLDDGVERVARLQVSEVRPRTENAECPQLAPMLVRNDIVRIVGARAGVAKASKDFTSQTASSDDAIGAVGIWLRAIEQILEILPDEGRSLTRGTPDHGLRIELDSPGIDSGDERLHLVVTKRPEDLGRHFDSTGGRFVTVLVVELDEPRVAVGILGRKAGFGASLLLGHDQPSLGCRRAIDIGTAREILGTKGHAADAIGKPAGVRNFVHGIDVERARVRRLVMRHGEQVHRDLIHEADVRGLRARRIAALRLALQRIVRIELRPGGEHRRNRQNKNQREAAD